MNELMRMHELLQDLKKDWMQHPQNAEMRNLYISELETSYEFLYDCWLRKLENDKRSN